MELTNLHYSQDVSSARLYIYEPDGQHYHSLGWIVKGPTNFREAELNIAEAKNLFTQAIDKGREIRVTNGGDHLILHIKDSVVLWPAHGDVERFWGDVERLLR